MFPQVSLNMELLDIISESLKELFLREYIKDIQINIGFYAKKQINENYKCLIILIKTIQRYLDM